MNKIQRFLKRIQNVFKKRGNNVSRSEDLLPLKGHLNVKPNNDSDDNNDSDSDIDSEKANDK